ncbi:MAG TPA: ROK family protein [Plasticicumulans sp.]|nr:ROK family protein [Plasticicumulans sp.]
MPPDTARDARRVRIGIDLGGTKIELLALDADGRECLRRRVPTPQGDYAATLQAIRALVEAAEQELGGRASVGLGTPGSASPRDGRMRNANSTCLNGRPLARDLEALLDRPLRFANDANCLALSEAVDGAAAGAGLVFAVILGTGVGGGLAAHGRVLNGHNGIAGEWGHNPLPWPAIGEHPGPLCWCGRSGCIETWLSGPGFARTHAREHGLQQLVPAETIVGRARAGDPAAATSLARYCERLARALATVVNLLDPEVIVLGGGLSRVDELYARVPALMTPHVFADAVDTPLRPALHGDSSGVRGAAWLWNDGAAVSACQAGRGD